MIEHVRERDANRLTETSSLEEIPSANDVVLAMVRAIKGIRMYLPNNPVLIRFIEEFDSRMTGHLANFGSFKLEVEPFALRYQGADVYENQDVRESMAFRIYSDGIRVLLFARGVERSELSEFLGVVGLEQSTHHDDDMVTELWKKSLPHIKCLLVEDFVEVDSEMEEALQPSQQESISLILATVDDIPPLHTRMIPAHLLMLTQAEASWLRKAKLAESRRNPLDDVINILLAIVAGTKDDRTFEDFVGILSGLTVDMFLSGDLGHAFRLVRFLDQLRTLGSTGPGQRQLVQRALTGILSEPTVQVLQATLDAGESVGHEELKELLQIFGLPSLGAICELLGRVEKLKTRKVIIEVLVELCRDHPELFAPFLSDPRWYLVRNVVLVLSLLDNPVALEMIVGLIPHNEARIRREVLGFLERSPDPKAKTYILKFFRDESRALRIRALQIMAREGLLYALKPALALTTAEDFKTRDLAEKKAVYETIGELGSESVLPLFRDMLRKRSWFKKSVEKESAICAVAGLLKMRNAAARQLLEETRDLKALDIRGDAGMAISSLAGGQRRAAAGCLEV